MRAVEGVDLVLLAEEAGGPERDFDSLASN
jgi:hypothetical protein